MYILNLIFYINKFYVVCFKIYKRELRIIDLEVCIILNSLRVYGFFGYMCILRCESKEKFLDNVIICLW